MSQVQQTAEEAFDSLTGFDEIAIAAHFGRTVTQLAEENPTMFGRAIVFAVKRREGLDDVKAKEAAFEMTLKDLNENFFAKPSEEESGKDEEPEQLPGTSLSSVS